MSATALQGPPTGEARLTLELPAEVIEAIAERAAAIVVQRLEQPAAESPFMTVAEAAGYARCKPQRIYDLLSSRRLTRHKDGARTLIQRQELEAYLAATTGPRTAGRADSISGRHRATVDSPGNRATR
jgi:excisionase family DNA binding protein